MRALYSIPRKPTACNVDEVTGKNTISGTKTAIFAESISRTMNSVHQLAEACRESRLQETSKAQNRVLIKCRSCGENFTELDFAYTKKTGLCIPCWEIGVV
jgi:formylmethanofuran dehydrogenase subunit E